MAAGTLFVYEIPYIGVKFAPVWQDYFLALKKVLPNYEPSHLCDNLFITTGDTR